MANLVPTSRIETFDVEISSMQTLIEERLAKDGIRPAYLWNTGVKVCELGLKFPEEDISLELFKELADKGYDFENPTLFLCQVLVYVYNLNVIKVMREGPKTAKIYAQMSLPVKKKDEAQIEQKS